MTDEQSSKFDLWLLRIVRYGLLLALLLPFLVLMSYLYPWVTGKIWGFEILVGVLFPFYLLLAFRRREFRPARNAFTYAILAFFAIATLSALLGDNIHRSFWSKPDRLTGLFFQYHLLAFFLMAGSVWRKNIKVPIMVSVGAAVILSVHALLQAYLGVGGETSGRGSATLGNPSYLAQILVPQLALCTWLFWKYRKDNCRWLWACMGAIVLLGTMATKSRGALVGLFVTVFVTVIFILIKTKGASKLKTAARVTFWSIMAAGALFLLFNASAFFPNARGLEFTSGVSKWLYEQRISIQRFRETSGPRELLLKKCDEGYCRPPSTWLGS